ncbi:hypothetical protein Tco_0329046 [Tanacetum coccineum]
MFCDNSVALHFANEPGVQKGARHYHRRYHYVHECIVLGEIRFLKVHIDDNLANLFTNALPKVKLTQHARSMGLRVVAVVGVGDDVVEQEQKVTEDARTNAEQDVGPQRYATEVIQSHNVLGIAPVAIIDRQLPFEYTITSRSTDVVVPISHASPTDSEYLRSEMRMRENQLAHMSLDEELCGTGMSWLCAPTRA